MKSEKLLKRIWRMRRGASITAQQQLLPLLLLLLWHTLNHHSAPPWLPWQPLPVRGVTPASLSFFFICCLSTRKCVNSACAPPVLPQPLPLFLLPSLINLPLLSGTRLRLDVHWVNISAPHVDPSGRPLWICNLCQENSRVSFADMHCGKHQHTSCKSSNYH